MSKTIISLYAKANCGKTKTIKSLFLKLGGDKNVIESKSDFVGSVNFGSKKIGFVSEGDPGSPQWENIEPLAKNNCDIIVTASRTKGDTVYNICDIASKYDYNVVWFSPFYFYDVQYGSDELCLYFAERNADNIAQYIIDKLI
jgi:hypothetical protein